MQAPGKRQTLAPRAQAPPACKSPLGLLGKGWGATVWGYRKQKEQIRGLPASPGEEGAGQVKVESTQIPEAP